MLAYSSVTDIIMITLFGSAFNKFLDKLFFIQNIVSGLSISCKVGRRMASAVSHSGLTVSEWPEAAQAWGMTDELPFKPFYQ